MKKMTSVLLMLVILAVFIPSSHALTCYLCTSIASSACGEPFKGVTTTCEAEYACDKTIINYDGGQRSCLGL